MTQKEFEIFAQKQAEKWRREHPEAEQQNQNTNKPKSATIAPHQQRIIEKPKSTYKHYLRVREVAKIISDDYKIEIGQNRLFEKMRLWGLIIPNITEPYQRAVREGYLVYLPKVISTQYGDKIVKWTKVTPKGTAYIINKIRNEIY